MTFTTVGFFPLGNPKTDLPAGYPSSNVKQISSAKGCLLRSPDISDDEKLNDLELFDTEKEALSTLTVEERIKYRVFGYALYHSLFTKGAETPIVLPQKPKLALPSAFCRLGYDVSSVVKSRSGFWAFDHSPLSCNGMAKFIATNEFCLLDKIEEAREVAIRFSMEEPEPGPYVIVAVFRRTIVN